MKKEIRLLGVDDAPFNKWKDKETMIIGTLFRGGLMLDGVLSAKVTVDGNDATAKIACIVNKSRFKSQLHAIMLDGIAVAGFNVVDIKKLNQRTGVPVIVVMRAYPNFPKFLNAIKKAKKEKLLKIIEKAGKIEKVGNIYVQFSGISHEKAKEIVILSCTRSHIPEPIRVAHLIGQGLVYGESKGNA